jgi:hypothetical protein
MTSDTNNLEMNALNGNPVKPDYRPCFAFDPIGVHRRSSAVALQFCIGA